MAIKSTIFKVNLQISDMDRHYYGNHALTIARHASETDERMMVRVFAFCCHAHDLLTFAGGLSDADEPDLWQKDLTGAIDLWIDVGLPDEKRILKASGRSRQVVIYAYGGTGAKLWWEALGPRTKRLKNLSVICVSQPSSQTLEKMAERTMSLSCTIQDGSLWISNDMGSVQIDYASLRASD